MEEQRVSFFRETTREVLSTLLVNRKRSTLLGVDAKFSSGNHHYMFAPPFTVRLAPLIQNRGNRASPLRLRGSLSGLEVSRSD